jgi:hypothetical protein
VILRSIAVAEMHDILAQDITEDQAQAYLSGNLPLPEEALELVSGGAACAEKPGTSCPRCTGKA